MLTIRSCCKILKWFQNLSPQQKLKADFLVFRPKTMASQPRWGAILLVGPRLHLHPDATAPGSCEMVFLVVPLLHWGTGAGWHCAKSWKHVNLLEIQVFCWVWRGWMMREVVRYLAIVQDSVKIYQLHGLWGNYLSSSTIEHLNVTVMGLHPSFQYILIMTPPNFTIILP